jgi:chemotaxis protein MotB
MRRIQHLRQRSRESQHAHDWLITYADMITLLLCFFALFLSVSMPRHKTVQVVTNEIHEEEQMSIPQLLAGMFPPHEIPKTVPSEKKLDSLPSIVDQHMDAVKAESETPHPKNPPPQPGQRLTAIDMNSAAFFALGSATLSEEGRSILGELSRTLQADNLREYQILVEGHTDDIPVSTPQFPSNWELSTARAAAVVRYFLEMGIAPQRLRAAGYADTFPKVPNRDGYGHPIAANQAQNRRVVIRLEKIEEAAPVQN